MEISSNKYSFKVDLKNQDAVYCCSFLNLPEVTSHCVTDLLGNVNLYRGTALYMWCGRQWNNTEPLWRWNQVLKLTSPSLCLQCLGIHQGSDSSLEMHSLSTFQFLVSVLVLCHLNSGVLWKIKIKSMLMHSTGPSSYPGVCSGWSVTNRYHSAHSALNRWRVISFRSNWKQEASRPQTLTADRGVNIVCLT